MLPNKLSAYVLSLLTQKSGPGPILIEVISEAATTMTKLMKLTENLVSGPLEVVKKCVCVRVCLWVSV